jgi:type IV conjugative transfer system protein TraE
MELKIAALNLDQIRKQRNLFILGFVILIIGNLFLSLKIFSMEENIVMVPGISQEMSITGGRVSRSYLEENSLLFLSALLDLTPDTVLHKRDMVLKYTSSRSKAEMQAIRDYFVISADEHKKFNMSTYFTPNKLDVNVKTLEVLASGTLSSSFGRKGWESKKTSYLLKFELAAGHLKLKEFFELKEIEDTKKSKKRGEDNEI